MVREDNFKRMTESNVYKLIMVLGVPTIISMLITNIYNMADTYFVGTLGDSAQGATGVLFTLMAVIQALAFMLGHGSGTYVAKFLADKDNKNASKYASCSFFSGLVIGLLLMMFGLIFIDGVCYMLGSTETILPYAKEYGMWILISAPFMITSLILNNVLRYEGKALFAMFGLASGGLLNIFGDFVFINLMNMGIRGAGLSTAISQIISFIILIVLFKIKAESKISPFNLSKSIIDYFKILRSGFPSFLRQALSSISGGVLNNLCKPYGDSVIAGMSVVNRYLAFAMSIGLGFGQGFQPVCAFNYQVKKYDRVKKGLVFTIVFGIILVSFLAIPGIVFPEGIMWLFNHDNKVIEAGTLALRIGCIGVLFLPISIAANMLYQCIRKSEIASFLAMLRSGLVFIPVLLIFEVNFKLVGIQISQPIADVISAVISLPFIIIFIIKNHENSEKEIEKQVKND